MSVSDTPRKAGPYDGTGTTGPFDFYFKVFSEDDVVVVRTDASGAETTLDATDYSVSLNADQESTPGGSVTLNDALAVGWLVTLASGVAATQSLALTNLGGFFPELVNAAFDRVTILCQQLAEQVSRAVKTGISSTVTPDELIGSLADSVSDAAGSASAAASSAITALSHANTASGFADDAEDSAIAAAASIAAIPSTPASQAEMEAGTEANLRSMSPLRVKQAVLALASPSPQIRSISASVAANALTISASALALDFRSTTLGSGTVSTVSGTPANLVISSGSTLGTVGTVASRIAVLTLNNAGTLELAAVNLAGGVNLDETGLISTTAEGGAGAADSATVVYSTTARSNLAYRVIGYVESTQATAGTWATAPSTIQGCGGLALAAMSSVGYGQVWQSVTRTGGVTYYNTSGKPIMLAITGNVSSDCSITVGGVLIGRTGTLQNQCVMIPTGAAYVITDTAGARTATSELR